MSGRVVNKSNKMVKVFAIIIIFLGIGLLIGGYFLDGNKTKESAKDAISEKSREAAKLAMMYSNITNIDGNYCGYYKLFTNKKMTAKDLSNDQIGRMIIFKLYQKEKVKENFEGKVFKKEIIEKEVKELFGNNISFKHETIGTCLKMDYDSDKGEYKVGENTCNTLCDTYRTKGRIYESNKKGNELKFSVRVLFAENDKYYLDYDKKIEATLEKTDKGKIKADSYDKAALYDVVFKLENGNYIFDYIEPVNE